MRVISQSFFDVLQECAPNDFVTKKISGEKYILNVTSFAITNSKCIRTEGECPVCKNPFWKGFSQEKYFTGNYFFIKPQNENTVLCRSSEILGDSYYAKYSLFCNEVLAEKLEKLFVNDVFLEKCLITPELTRNSV